MLQRRVSPAAGSIRRLLQVVALVGTLIVGIIALALIVSQTPWFREWLLRYAVKESKQYLNGDLTIGGLEGNVFYGVRLHDVAIDVNGEHVVTIKDVELKYSLPELLTKGIVIPEIRLEEPFVLARHDASGWNLASLIKRQEQEADRRGPERPISLPQVEVLHGRAIIDDRAPAAGYRLPARIDELTIKGGFGYEPVHYSVTLEQFSFAGKSPDLKVTKLAGRFGVRDDDLHVEQVQLQTSQSSVILDGVIRGYLSHPSLQIDASSSGLSLPELVGVVPSLNGYDLHPSFHLRAAGPLDKLDLTADSTSEAGTIAARLVADLAGADFRARGTVDATSLNLAPILQSPAQKSDITGRGNVDLRIAAGPPDKPVIDRLRLTYSFQGPLVVAAGYRAERVTAKGDVLGRRISFDGRANAYGGSATAKGSIETPPDSPVRFDIAGSAGHIDLRNLPAALNVPKLATDLNASGYHVQGRAGDLQGNVTLERSMFEGATVEGGTTAEFGVTGKDVRYAGRGSASQINLSRIGTAFKIDALAKPEYDSTVNGQFDVRGRGTSIDQLTLDATANFTDSQVLGGTIPRLAADVHLDRGALQWRANGDFRDFDPARVLGNDEYKGHVSGTVDAGFGIKDVSAPITPDSLTADGRVTVTKSDVAGVQIDAADIQGQYAARRGALRQATVKGPDIELQASGPIALDETGSTNVKYHIAAPDLATIGQRFKQTLGGSATVDGDVTGNAKSLQATGTLNGSNLSYEENRALDANSTFTVTLPDLDVNRTRVEAQTTATFLQAGGLHINELKAKTTYAEHKLDFDAHVAEGPPSEAAVEATSAAGGPARELDAGGTVIFHPDHQEIHLPRLALRTQGVEWKMAPGSDAAVQYSKDRLDLGRVRLMNGAQTIELNGALGIGENAATNAVDVAVRNVDLVELDRLLLQNRGLRGTLNGDAKITGTLKAPVVDGHLAVTGGGFQAFSYQSLDVKANYALGDPAHTDSGRVVLDTKLVQGPGVELTVSGTLPLTAMRPNPPGVTGHVEAHAGDQIDLKVQSSSIDLGILQGFTKQLTKVTGTLQADLRVTGSGEDPHVNGTVDIRGGAFTVPAAKTSFSGLTTTIDFENETVRVPRFQILDQHGKTMTIVGELAVHQRQAGAVNISIDSDDFKLFDNELGDLHIESHLKLTGDVRKPKLEGEVRADAARVEIDKVLLAVATPYAEEALPDVVSADQGTAASTKGADETTKQALEQGREASQRAGEETVEAESKPSSGPLTALALDVHFVAADNVVVRGQSLRPGGPTAAQIGSINTTVGADVQVQKAAGSTITLRGTVNTVRGFYEFQGRRFEIVRDGTVRFLGLPEINPQLDITAQRLIPNSGVTAIVHVTGRMRSPQLALTSTPPLDEADILSLILFNRSVNDLGTGERASLAETAGGIASGFVASPLSRSIGKALDVDLFEITTSDPQTGETAGGVTLGKQVSDKAFVRFRQQFGQRSFTEFMIEYRLATFLRLDATVAPETSAAANRLTQQRVERGGVDLIFFFSY